jgi:hypothetical protein
LLAVYDVVDDVLRGARLSHAGEVHHAQTAAELGGGRAK